MPVSHPAADTDRVGGIELESEFEQTAGMFFGFASYFATYFGGFG